MKEADDRVAQLSRNYERKLEEIKAQVASLQSTCEHIVRQRQQEAQITREELEANHPQYEMGETIIKALVAKHRQRFNHKIEEALACAWQEWSAQATELQILWADAENQ